MNLIHLSRVNFRVQGLPSKKTNSDELSVIGNCPRTECLSTKMMTQLKETGRVLLVKSLFKELTSGAILGCAPSLPVVVRNVPFAASVEVTVTVHHIAAQAAVRDLDPAQSPADPHRLALDAVVMIAIDRRIVIATTRLTSEKSYELARPASVLNGVNTHRVSHIN